MYAGSGNVALASAVAHQLGIALESTGVARFSDGETYVNVGHPRSIRGNTAIVIQSCMPSVNERLVEALLLIDAIRRHHPKRLIVIFPFFPYRRQQRQSEEGESVTSELVARLLETAGATSALLVEPHSMRLMEFFHIPVKSVTALDLFAEHWQRMKIVKPLVVAQDRGAVSRAQWVAAVLGSEIILLEKKRQSHDAVAGLTMNPAHAKRVVGATCLIVDDEINTGGTVVRAIEVLNAAGAKEIHVAATHAVLSGPAIERLSAASLASLVVTDSIGLSLEKRLPSMTVLSIAPLIAAAVKDIVAGRH